MKKLTIFRQYLNLLNSKMLDEVLGFCDDSSSKHKKTFSENFPQGNYGLKPNHGQTNLKGDEISSQFDLV